MTKTKFADCYALSELPYFVLDGAGRLKVSPDLDIRVIDAHTHIGLSHFFRGKIDFWAESPEVLHNFPARGNPIDLENYSWRDLTEQNRKFLQRDLVAACFTGSARARTHTIANFLREMDDLRVASSIVLAIAVRFAFNNNDAIFENLKDPRAQNRLIPFCCIHPAHGRFAHRLDDYIARGAKGLKFHPVFQGIGPEDERSLALFRECAARGLPILSHTSASGSEPKRLGAFGRLERFREAIRAAADVPFVLGHSGMGDQFEQALAYAVEYDNVYLEVSGQPIGNLKKMFDRMDHSRILFGTDWPFYHAAMQLAKVLIATEGDEALRRKVLYENSARVLEIEK
ncbi:MAG: amidohydrolase family protein [bacterium]